MSNLKLWDSVKTPDTKYIKQVSMRGGFTAVDAQYLIMEATKQFGPYGLGFGLCSSNFDYTMIDPLKIAVHNAVFFYISEGNRVEFPITNAIEVVSKNGHVDGDFAKKAETNTLSKALSKIGFAADVYMGMFDDQDYVRGVAAEKEIERAEQKEAEARKKYDEIKLYVLGEIESISKVSAIAQAERAVIRVIEKVRTRCAPAGIATKGFEQLLNKSIEDRKNEK